MNGSTHLGYPFINDDVLYKKLSDMQNDISSTIEAQDKKVSILQTIQTDMRIQLITNDNTLTGLSCCVCCLFIAGVVLFGLVIHLYVK
jgi:hypothetical protein